MNDFIKAKFICRIPISLNVRSSIKSLWSLFHTLLLSIQSMLIIKACLMTYSLEDIEIRYRSLGLTKIDFILFS